MPTLNFYISEEVQRELLHAVDGSEGAIPSISMLASRLVTQFAKLNDRCKGPRDWLKVGRGGQ